MDVFPKFLRPNIVKVLKYVLEQKRIGNCSKVLIYTNNQGPRSWAQMIAAYLDTKTGQKTFDQIVAAFQVDGKIVETCRTSQSKRVEDLIRCTGIPSDTQICFLDDQYHSMMVDNDVYYILLEPYSFSMPLRDMAERYYAKVESRSGEGSTKYVFVDSIVRYMKRYHFQVREKDKLEERADKAWSKVIIAHVEAFFKRSRRTKGPRTEPPYVISIPHVALISTWMNSRVIFTVFVPFAALIGLVVSSGATSAVLRSNCVTSIAGKEPLLAAYGGTRSTCGYSSSSVVMPRSAAAA